MPRLGGPRRPDHRGDFNRSADTHLLRVPLPATLGVALRDLLDVLATTTKVAIDEKQFRTDVDPQQVAFEMYGIMAAAHAASRLVGDPKAGARTRRALEALLTRCR